MRKRHTAKVHTHLGKSGHTPKKGVHRMDHHQNGKTMGKKGRTSSDATAGTGNQPIRKAAQPGRRAATTKRTKISHDVLI